MAFEPATHPPVVGSELLDDSFVPVVGHVYRNLSTGTDIPAETKGGRIDKALALGGARSRG